MFQCDNNITLCSNTYEYQFSLLASAGFLLSSCETQNYYKAREMSGKLSAQRGLGGEYDVKARVKLLVYMSIWRRILSAVMWDNFHERIFKKFSFTSYIAQHIKNIFLATPDPRDEKFSDASDFKIVSFVLFKEHSSRSIHAQSLLSWEIVSLLTSEFLA